MFFFGKLPGCEHIKFILEDMGEDSMGCTYINDRNGYTSPISHAYPKNFYYVIKLNNKCITNTEQLFEVICHEMIHIWQWEEIDFSKYSGDYSWINGHNKTFIAKMNAINLKAKTDYDLKLNVKLVYSE